MVWDVAVYMLSQTVHTLLAGPNCLLFPDSVVSIGESVIVVWLRWKQV